MTPEKCAECGKGGDLEFMIIQQGDADPLYLCDSLVLIEMGIWNI